MAHTSARWAPASTADPALQRPLGFSEFAFFPASKDGLGDMFLHLAFRAPIAQLSAARVLNAWALLRNRHPLLACKVVLVDDDIPGGKTPCFSFSPPANTEEALEEAKGALYFRHESKEDLILNYMNGPRTLSTSRISYLVISTPEKATALEDELEQEYDLLMCAPHFTGDGTSLHQCTHDLLALLASPASDSELLQSLDLSTPWDIRLPPAFETRCAVPQSRFAQAVAKVNFLQSLEKEIGGHKFARHQRAPQHTVYVERVFGEAETKGMLKRCKENGVTVNHALEAISALAWSRVVEARSENREPFKDPIMLYTAINLRPHLLPFPPSLPPPCHVLSPSDQTYWFLALTYFTLVLPAFPAASARAFWLRARSAKAQTHRMVHSRLLVPRALEMADLRAARARGTPRPDLTLADLSPADSSSPSTPTPPLLPGPAPSTALLGLSLIGNLDATYDRRAYPAFTLRDVTTASRQKAGGVLLLVHTFGGKLWVQMFYDECGFGEEMERFWEEVGRGVERYLVN